MYEMYIIDGELTDYLVEDRYDDEDNMPEYGAGIMDVYDLEEEVMEDELPIVIREVMSTLTPRERFVLYLHYGFITTEGVTLKVIGNLLGIKPDRVRQIRDKALRKLRHPSRARKLISWAK